MAKEEIVKTAEEVISELDAKITEQKKALEEANQTIQIKDKALQEATHAILELTEQLHQKKDVQPGEKTVSIKGKKYPLLLAEVNHKGKLIKYEDFVADEKLALEVLEMDAGVFGAAL